jgi:hypothetical protein
MLQVIGITSLFTASNLQNYNPKLQEFAMSAMVLAVKRIS